MIRIELERKWGDYGFEARDAQNHHMALDTSLDNGGVNAGIRPMQSLLMALGGCSGIDVVSILKKQRQTISHFTMQIVGEREPGAIPSLWKSVHVVFQSTGAIDEEKARKACALSVEKYCSVAETLRRAGAAITWEVRVERQ
ncbi:MAG: OsmC family protein [Flavisolibacter sp.]|nr:OsmC family protein [Flavisolibacter sp.]